MRFLKLSLVAFLSVAVSSSSTFPYRKLLSLKAYCNERDPEYATLYVGQGMISLFRKHHSDSPGFTLLRTTVLNSIMEAPGSVMRQAVEFEDIIDNNSKGLLSGILIEENSGPEPPIELLSLYNGHERRHIRKVIKNVVELDVVLCKSAMKMEEWQKRSIFEATVAWKEFREYFSFILCDWRLLDLTKDVYELTDRDSHMDEKFSDLDTNLFNLKEKEFDLSNSECNVEVRLHLYLNRYVKFLRPIMQKFKGLIFAKGVCEIL